jgi:hypothetical protein
MFNTPEEVAEAVRLTGASGPEAISTYVTSDPVSMPGASVSVDRLISSAASAGFDFHAPKAPSIVANCGAPLEGRCLRSFLYARVSFSGKAYFCPFIRVEVGDLTTVAGGSLDRRRYVALRKKLVEEQLFPVCRRCCKVELTPSP